MQIAAHAQSAPGNLTASDSVMNKSKNTILITGGSSGIGMELAERFSKEGHTVIICARGEERLKAVQARNPDIHIRVCDVGGARQREELAAWVMENFPKMNILINNAGVQQFSNIRDLNGNWDWYEQEIDINLKGPIHLTMLFADHLLKQESAAIVSVTGGVAYTPIAAAPIYGATKAGIHNFTRSMRDHFAGTAVEIIEIIPPSVGGTYLGGRGLRTGGVPLGEYMDSVMKGFHEGKTELTYEVTDQVVYMTRDELEQRTVEITKMIPVPPATKK
jgi:Short-chain dehydrogenase involved in D-alanine esterification of lipoteichoic acid and wall teichoic acid (D-alanine transfer protein)